MPLELNPNEEALTQTAPPLGAVWFCLFRLDDGDQWQRVVRPDWGKADRWWRHEDHTPIEVSQRAGAGIYRARWTEDDRRKWITMSGAWQIAENGTVSALDPDGLPDAPAPTPPPQPQTPPTAEARAPFRPPSPPPNPAPPKAPQGSPSPGPESGLGEWLPPPERQSHLADFAGIFSLVQQQTTQALQTIQVLATSTIESERQRSDAFGRAMLGFFSALQNRPQDEGQRDERLIAPLRAELERMRARLETEETVEELVERRMEELVEGVQQDGSKMEAFQQALQSPLGASLLKLVQSGMSGDGEGAGGDE